jgi:hypothetical protein
MHLVVGCLVRQIRKRSTCCYVTTASRIYDTFVRFGEFNNNSRDVPGRGLPVLHCGDTTSLQFLVTPFLHWADSWLVCLATLLQQGRVRCDMSQDLRKHRSCAYATLRNGRCAPCNSKTRGKRGRSKNKRTLWARRNPAPGCSVPQEQHRNAAYPSPNHALACLKSPSPHRYR